MTSTPPDPLLGQTVDDRYRVTSRLARGGMATVYRATDTRLDRPVAIKVLHPHLAEGRGFIDRFRREARSAAQLVHPGIVAVYDQGTWGESPYLVMELVDGPNLRAIMDSSGLPPVGQALDLMAEALAALAAAHTKGFVHRDVKPENILITAKGQVKVADFGLARTVAEVTAASSGIVLGTVAYLSPELVADGVADQRADIYAAGVVLFELLTGSQPYTAEAPIQVAFQHVHADFPAPSSRVKWLPQEIDSLVAALTAKDPNRRPPDAAAALSLVRAVRAALPPEVAARAALVAVHRATSSLPDAVQPAPAARPDGAPRPPDGAGLGAATSPNPDPDPGQPGPDPAASPQGAPDPAPAPDDSPDADTTPNDPDGRGAAPGGPRPGQTRTGPGADSSPNARPSQTGPDGPGAAPGEALAEASSPRGQSGQGGDLGRAGAIAAAARYSGAAGDHDGGPRRAGGRADGIGQQMEAGAGGQRDGLTERVPQARSGTGGTHALPLATLPPGGAAAAAGGRARRQRSRAWIWLLVAALVLAGGGGGAWWYYERGPGSLVALPELAGQTRQAAEDSLRQLGLVGEVRLEHSDTVAEGLVIRTGQAPGAKLKPEAIVELTVSLGIRLATVPAEGIVGASAEEAEAALAAAGLDGEVTRSLVWDTWVAAGVVISAEPGGGAEVPHNQAVTLVVSQGPEPVEAPKLAGLTLEEAEAAAASFDLTVVEGAPEYSETVPEGQIIAQSPDAGGQTQRGAAVTVVISLGMPFVEVPKLSGLNWDEAVAKLAALGLEAKRENLLMALWGSVYYTDPAEGTSVRKGSTVTLYMV